MIAARAIARDASGRLQLVNLPHSFKVDSETTNRSGANRNTELIFVAVARPAQKPKIR